MFQNYLFNVE